MCFRLVARLQHRAGWTSVGRTPCVDPCSGRRISRRRRWFEPALGVAYVINYSVRISSASTSTRRSRILCDHAGDAVGPLRDVHCAEFRSLVFFLGIYFAKQTFDFAVLASMAKNGLVPGNVVWLAFAGIFLGLAVKVPLFPFHTWLPDAYQTAPTGVSMVLTGVLSKMGVYGFVRLLLPLFPNQIKIIGPWLLALAICSIVFAPLAAWAQRDLKRMIAYLSINHLGYCMLALFAVAASPTVG